MADRPVVVDDVVVGLTLLLITVFYPQATRFLGFFDYYFGANYIAFELK